MASEYELVAMLIDQDRFFMEIDEWGIAELLKKILRECYDLNNPKYDANDLGGLIASHIIGFVANGDGDNPFEWWPEEEGSGPHSLEQWARLDAGEVEPVKGGQSHDLDQLDLPDHEEGE